MLNIVTGIYKVTYNFNICYEPGLLFINFINDIHKIQLFSAVITYMYVTMTRCPSNIGNSLHKRSHTKGTKEIFFQVWHEFIDYHGLT